MYPLPMQQQQSRAIMQRHVQIVDHNQYRLPLVSVNIAQQLKNLILVRQIQIGQWLVQQHYRGLLSQCPRQHHTPQLSPAHLARLGETQMPRIRLLHATLHNIPILLRLVLQTPLVRVAPHQHRLKSRELKIGLRILPHKSHALRQLACRIAVHPTPSHKHLTPVRHQQSRHQAQQSRLPAAVGTHHRIHTPLLKPHIQPLQHRLPGIAITQILQFNHHWNMLF